MPPIDAATLARLRVRYVPDAAPTCCTHCGSTLIARAGWADEGRLLWQCLSCTRFCGTALVDPDVVALLDAYEALARERSDR